MLRQCVILLGLVVVGRALMEGFIVGSEYTSIMRYPHSSLLTTSCIQNGQLSYWTCGSSIVNQYILLTAGHCVYGCNIGTHMVAHLGDDTRRGSVLRSASSFLLHEKYDAWSSANDIALIKLYKPLKFTSKVSRVALMKRPPYREMAHLAGWGTIDERTDEQAIKLKHVAQKVWKHADCDKKFNGLPVGTICASAPKPSDYAARGDSGSALVVRGYIQIGLVSYRVPEVALNIIVYTDTGYFYDWINYNAERLYCLQNKLT